VFTVCVRLETSGKWPNDVEAIRRTKTAVLHDFAQQLQKAHGYLTALTPESLKVLKDGFVFSLFLGVERELYMMEMTRDGRGVRRERENPGSVKLRRDIVHRPMLTSHLSA
jgi:U3 small nucleolar RNA-associated protein 22